MAVDVITTAGVSAGATVIVAVIGAVIVIVPVLGGTTVIGNGVAVGCSTGGVVSQVRRGSSVVFEIA